MSAQLEQLEVPTTIPFLQFEDKHSYSTSGYWETNEEPTVHRQLLKGLSFKRAAAISSGGEVALFSVLPRVTEELFLVDHSYVSLYACMLKVAALRTWGVEKTYEIILDENAAKVSDAFSALQSSVPAEVAQGARRSYYGSFASKQLVTPQLGGARREWYLTPLSTIRAAARKLHLLRFVHGDITDLAPHGPFDLFYISNALEHYSRDTRKPELSKIAAMLAPKGRVLLTGGSGWSDPIYSKNGLARLLPVNKVRGYRTSWNHILLQKAEGESGQGAAV